MTSTIEQLESLVKTHASKIGIIVEEPGKIAAMVADRWEWMSKNRMSCSFPLEILPLMESMDLVTNPEGAYWIAFDFHASNEQTGSLRTVKCNTKYACYLHQQLRGEGYYQNR